MQTNGTKPGMTLATKLALDLLIFTGFLLAMEPRSTGIAIHEWLTLSALAAITLHLLLNWSWIVQVTKRFFKKVSGMARINYVLNWLLFLDGILVMLSGILISKVAIPALGITLPEGFAWRSLHSLSADLSLVLLGLHTALHWSWVTSTFRRLVFQPIGRIFSRSDSPQAVAPQKEAKA